MRRGRRAGVSAALLLLYGAVLVSVFHISKEISYTLLVRSNVSVQLPAALDNLLPDTGPQQHHQQHQQQLQQQLQQLQQQQGERDGAREYALPNIPSRVPRFNVTLHPGNLCADKDLFLFIYVHTAPEHVRQRMLIRQTFANPANLAYKGIKLRAMFVVGAVHSKPVLSKALMEESATQRDILQENFSDTYRNLSYKGLAALRYVSTYCRHVPFILKTDDDIFVNIFSLVRHLQRLPSYGDLPEKAILCFIWTRMRVIRDVGSKWYVSKQEWEPDYYSHYCSGSAYVLTAKAAVALHQASYNAPFLWVDDFYITGLLAQAGGVNLTSFHGVYKLHFNEFKKKYDSNMAVGMTYIFSHVHDFNQYRALWNKIALEQGGHVVSYAEMIEGVRT